MSGLGGRLTRAIDHDRAIVVNSASLIGAAALTSALGAAFWWVAAREFSQQAVGVASAAVAAMMILGFLATAGLGTLLMGELPRLRERRRGVINAALVVSAAIGAVIGAAFALLVPLGVPDLGPLGGTWTAVAVFAVGVALTALTLVLDQAMIGLLRGGLQLWRNAVFSIAKLAALVALAGALSGGSSVLIYSTWVLGIGLSLVALGGFYRRRVGDPLRPSFDSLRRMKGSAATHHAFNVALRTPELVMPVVVISVLSATANASFYIAWMIAGLLFVVPISLATVLYAAASGDDSRLDHRFRLSLLLSLTLGVIANLVLLPGAAPLLGLFGQDYATDAAVLHVLALGVFPEAIRTHYVAVRRIERRLGSALPVIWGGAALEIAGGATGALLGGLVGVAIGWLGAICVEALIMGGDVLRALGRGASAGPGATAPQRRGEREALGVE